MYNIETFNWIATNVNKTQTFTHKMCVTATYTDLFAA